MDAVAQLAPTLKEAELRVLLHLCAVATAAGSLSVPASSRDLEVAVRVARSNIVLAIDALAKRGLIAVRKGTPRTPATYLLRFLEVAQMPKFSGPATGPPPREQETLFPQGADLLQDRSGPFPGPPPTANQQLASAAEIVDPEGVLTLEGILDRLSAATPKAFEPMILAKARRWMQSYRAKLGDPRNWDGPQPPHPPDDRITAQFLSMGDGAGGWPRLERLLYDLMHERREPGHSYAWFVTIAAQRIHGIDPRVLKRKREELKLVKAKRQEAEATAADELQDIQQRIRALAQKRRICK